MRMYGAKERAPDDMSVLARTASGSQEVIFDVGDEDGRATFELEHTFLQRGDGILSGGQRGHDSQTERPTGPSDEAQFRYLIFIIIP